MYVAGMNLEREGREGGREGLLFNAAGLHIML